MNEIIQHRDIDNNKHLSIKQEINKTSLRVLFSQDPAGFAQGIGELVLAPYAWWNRKDVPNTDTLKEWTTTITAYLLRDHPFLLWQELETIFDKGKQEQLGDNYGFSVGTYMKWVTKYEESGEHDRLIRAMYAEMETKALKALPQHGSGDDVYTQLQRNYAEYRESVLSSEHARMRAQATGSIGAAFRKINPSVAPKCGDPLWDGEGLDFAGARARWMNEHGFPGANLKEIFDNMIRKGIEKF